MKGNWFILNHFKSLEIYVQRCWNRSLWKEKNRCDILC